MRMALIICVDLCINLNDHENIDDNDFMLYQYALVVVSMQVEFFLPMARLPESFPSHLQLWLARHLQWRRVTCVTPTNWLGVMASIQLSLSETGDISPKNCLFNKSVIQ